MRNRRSMLGKRCSLRSDSRSSFCRRTCSNLCELYVRRLRKPILVLMKGIGTGECGIADWVTGAWLTPGEMEGDGCVGIAAVKG